MVNFIPQNTCLYRYDPPEISKKIFEQGSIRITTLNFCRKCEDAGEGTKVTTSIPGTNSLNKNHVARLLGMNANSIRIEGSNAFVTKGENAVRREESLPNAFVYCTSTLENNKFLKGKYGKGCLKITNPLKFFELVDNELRNQYKKFKPSKCVVDHVEYTHRIANYKNHTNKHVAFIKPPGTSKNYESEREVRALWIPEQFDIEPFVLNVSMINNFLEYA